MAGSLTMSTTRKDNDPLGGKRQTLSVYHVTLALIVGAAIGAMPIGLDLNQGQLSLSQNAAYAQGGGNGGGGGGNGGGGGGGNDGGGGGGDGGSGDGGGRDNGNSGVGGGTSTGGTNGSTSSVTGPAAAPDVTEEIQILPLAIATPEVLRAQFTTMIKRGDPVNAVNIVDDPHMPVSFFTEVRGMKGRTVTHRWIRGGVVEYEVSFKVKGATWKVWSTQLLPADKPGTWQVETVTDGNKVIRFDRLYYRPVG
jgi:hypothetical protein